MMVLITYDVETMSIDGKRRLRKISKVCQNYGQRVQNSVFEMNIDYGTFLQVKDKLCKIINKKNDSLRFYYLGKNWKRRVEHIGAKETYDSEGLLLV